MTVAVQEVQPPSQLVLTLCHLRGPVPLGDVARGWMDDRSEVVADKLLGLPARQALTGVRDEAEARVGIDCPDQVR